MKNNFVRCLIKYSPLFITELILSYALAWIMVKGNTIIGDVIDDMLAGKSVEFKGFIGILLVFTMAGFVLAFVRSVAVSQFALRVQTAYKNMVAHKLYRLEYKYFDVNGSASVLNKINSDIYEMETLLSENIPEICTNAVEMITYAVYVGRINIKLLLLICICYPALLYASDRIVKKIVALKKSYRQKSDIITEISQDCVSGILALRSFGAEDYFQKKLNKAADELVENESQRTRISNNAILLRRMLQWMPNIMCSVYAYYMAVNGTISMGELVVFIMILQKFIDAYVGVPFNMVDAREKLVCVRRVEDILSGRDEESGNMKEGLTTDNAIEFENVDFAYNEETPVLKGISFTIGKNENVAFVGESGGGKSTIFHIICGFYRINGGFYRLYGRDFSQWDVEAARNNMALVSQNVFLFPSTIMENVRYGNLTASDEEVMEACRKARIHDFIMGLPEKYNSLVGERGILLSGGERQRISIARAFLKNAPILLLDEPTSAVDVETEKLIKEALDKLCADRTCVTIAHRLSTICNADKIMVIKDGRIAESGRHEELLSKNGTYSQMYGNEIHGREGAI